MSFKIPEECLPKLIKWISQQDQKVIKEQKSSAVPETIRNSGYAYYGCTGGGYTYSFTPTTIGMCISVKNNITKEEIDLTEDTDW